MYFTSVKSCIDMLTSKPRSAALVAVRGRQASSALHRLSPPAGPCRPGDQAEWVRLDLTQDQGARLREAAGKACVSVDVWLAVMVEFSLSLRELINERRPG